MALNYPGRTFAGSKNPSEWFGNVTPAKDSRWKPRMASEGGGMPSAGYMPADMWASVKRQAPGDLADVEDPAESAQKQQAFAASNSLRENMATGQGIIKQRRQAMMDKYSKGSDRGGTLGGYDDTLRQVGRSEYADYTPWGDFYAALVGKEANTQKAGMKSNINIGSMGRLKAQDVPTGKVYDTEGGEVAPGLRGAPPEWAQAQQGLRGGSKGWYTPDEWSGMGQLSQSRVRGSMFNR